MIDDAELARRSLIGFGETVATLGRWGVGPDAVLRRPDALGARIDAATGNPWLSAAVVPPGATPPADDPALPYCVWTFADAVPGRVEAPDIATPCLGLSLDALDLTTAPLAVETPPLATVGAINERAYGQFGVLAPILRALRDDRVRAHGLRVEGEVACVALTLAIGDDLSIQYVATEAPHRRRGLAGRLLVAVMAEARTSGLRTATLQASPAGLSVYERLGFRRVETMRGFLRPGA